MLKRIKAVVVCILICLFISVPVINATQTYGTNNKGYVVEVLNYMYDGFVQCQPYSWYLGCSPARCWLRFKNGSSGDTGPIYSSYGTGFYDKNIYKVYKRYTDTLSLFAPETDFSFGFQWVDVETGVWPV